MELSQYTRLALQVQEAIRRAENAPIESVAARREEAKALLEQLWRECGQPVARRLGKDYSDALAAQSLAKEDLEGELFYHLRMKIDRYDASKGMPFEGWIRTAFKRQTMRLARFDPRKNQEPKVVFDSELLEDMTVPSPEENQSSLAYEFGRFRALARTGHFARKWSTAARDLDIFHQRYFRKRTSKQMGEKPHNATRACDRVRKHFLAWRGEADG